MSDALTSLDRLLQSNGDLPFSGWLHSMPVPVSPSYLEVFSIFRQDFLYGKCTTRCAGRHYFVDEFPTGKARMAIV